MRPGTVLWTSIAHPRQRWCTDHFHRSLLIDSNTSPRPWIAEVYTQDKLLSHVGVETIIFQYVFFVLEIQLASIQKMKKPIHSRKVNIKASDFVSATFHQARCRLTGRSGCWGLGGREMDPVRQVFASLLDDTRVRVQNSSAVANTNQR